MTFDGLTRGASAPRPRLTGALQASGRSVIRYLDGPKLWGAILIAAVHAAAAVAAFHGFAWPRVPTRAVEPHPGIAVDATLPVIVITAHRVRDARAHGRHHAIPSRSAAR